MTNGMIEKGAKTIGYKLTLVDELLGGSPLDKEIYKQYILKELGDDNDWELETIEPEVDEDGKPIKGAPIITGFHRDNDGIYLLAHQIKGYLKEAGNTIKDMLKIKALKSKIDNFVFVSPDYIFLAEKPDGICARPLRAMTMQGPRVSIARSLKVDAGKIIKFKITILENKEIKEATIDEIMDYGLYKGLCQWRNSGKGRFTWEKIDPEHLR